MPAQLTRLTITLAVVLTALPAAALATDNPYTQPDDTWISLSGTAVETDPASFTLDYGKGSLSVEMDDWSWYEGEGHGLIEDDLVTVYGVVEDKFAEQRTIEARGLYVESLGRYFYADSANEEDQRYSFNPPIVPGFTELTGTVTGISGEAFTIDSGAQQLTIDSGSLHYDPLDDRGYMQVDIGDLVTVTGEMETDIGATMELMADFIVILDDRKADPSR